MPLKQIIIQNFKSLRNLKIQFNKGLNILVGDNEAGKSTILEAIHLALTGIYRGRNIKGEISQYLFNNEVVEEYLKSLKSKNPCEPPRIVIEVYFEGSIDPVFEGDNFSDKTMQQPMEGFRFSIVFSEQFKEEYEIFIKNNEIHSLPTEYYVVSWEHFGRSNITTRQIPIKSVIIDSSNYRYQNGSDVYISRIVKDLLNQDDIVEIIL